MNYTALCRISEFLQHVMHENLQISNISTERGCGPAYLSQSFFHQVVWFKFVVGEFCCWLWYIEDSSATSKHYSFTKRIGMNSHFHRKGGNYPFPDCQVLKLRLPRVDCNRWGVNANSEDKGTVNNCTQKVSDFFLMLFSLI